MNVPDPEEMLCQIVEVATEFFHKFAEAMESISEALKEFFHTITFRVLPAWYFDQTHYSPDTRYMPTAISKTLSEIFYPYAPPDFLSVN